MVWNKDVEGERAVCCSFTQGTPPRLQIYSKLGKIIADILVK